MMEMTVHDAGNINQAEVGSCVDSNSDSDIQVEDLNPRPFRNRICLWPDKSVTVCQGWTKSDALRTLDEVDDSSPAEITRAS